VSVELISIVILVLLLVIATWRDVNMGILGFVAAFVLGTFFLNLEINDIWNGFPVDLFVALVGLTYLFGFAQNNGAIEVLVTWSLRLARGNAALGPWIFFALTAAVMAMGAVFSIGIVTPLALSFAYRHRINQFMMGLLVVHGALAGAFSPISVYGVFINGFLSSRGLEAAPLSLFIAPFLFNLMFSIVMYLVLHHRQDPHMLASSDRAVTTRTVTTGASPNGPDPATAERHAQRLTGYQIATLVALATMVVLVIGFNLNIGVVSMALAALLAILRPSEGLAALGRVSWSVVVLIAGVLTYIGVLQQAGTVEWVSNGISTVSIPLGAALLLFYMSGFVSALASSVGVIGVVIALVVPFLQSGDVHVAGFVAALGISATIVDISPFSTGGAMLLANVRADIRDWYYRRMLAYAGLMCLIGPGLAWFVAAVPTLVLGP
jgi:Na+/H+ antiporter NhaD/arsenite permease-like protein